MAKQHSSVKPTGAHHMLATIRSTGRTMAVAGLLTAISGALLVEVYGVFATGSITTFYTHLFALAFALVCGYGAIVTVLLRGVIATLVDSLEWVSGEVQRFAGGVVREAETALHDSVEHDAAQELVDASQ